MSKVSSLLAGLFFSACHLSSAANSASWTLVQNEFVESAPAVAEVHASTVVEASDGTLVAAWFGGTKEGYEDVAIWISRREQNAWKPATAVVDGRQPDGRRFPTWNPVLHRAADGRLVLFFKVGPSPEQWWGEALVSSDDGRTWKERRRLPAGIIGAVKNKPLRLSDGRLLCPSSVEYSPKHWAVRFETTDEKLSSWRSTNDIADPDNFSPIQPTLLVHPDGRLQALCRTSRRELAQTWSKDGGATWSPLRPTGIFVPNSGVDAITLREGGFLLVYNPSPKSASKTAWGERNPLVVAHSKDGCAWRTVVTLERLPVRNGYAYPAVIQTSDGRIHITYTWNRARVKHALLESR